MNKFIKSIVSFGAVVLAVAACQKPEEFKPGEPDADGCYGVYFDETSISEVFAPEDEKIMEITLLRTQKDGAITVPLVVDASSEGVLKFSELKFDDGAGEATLTVTMDAKAEIGVEYTATVTIEDPQYASRYGVHATTADLSVLIDKWNSLGKAKVHDTFFFENEYEVALEQNDLNKNRFRLVAPYAEGLTAEKSVIEGAGLTVAGTGPKYVYFTLLKKGDVLNEGEEGEFSITADDLVLFDSYASGVKYGDNNIGVYYPNDMFSDCSISDIEYNKVLGYQEGENKDLPTAVQFAPVYYWRTNYEIDNDQDGIYTVVFPGVTLTDYSIDVATYDSEDGELPVEFELGTDVATVKYAVFEGELSNKIRGDKAEEIGAGTAEGIVTLTAAELEAAEYAVSLTLEATGKYTLVAVAFDAEGEAQDYASASFGYIAKGDDSHQIVLTSSLLPASSASLRYVLFGSDLTKVKIQAFSKEYYDENTQKCLYLTYSDEVTEDVGDDGLALVNGSGLNGTVTEILDLESKTYASKLKPDTEYVLVVYVENGYRSDFIVLDAKTLAE